MMVEILYSNHAAVLRNEFARFELRFNKANSLDKPTAYEEKSQLNLFNAIAKRRFEIMERNKENLF